ncbi:hypothetical protein GCM10008965_35060 [Methylorubrum aminovorans]|nr:hypothetical protein GCM10025880_63060 [Methylorubrum aminovorans]
MAYISNIDGVMVYGQNFTSFANVDFPVGPIELGALNLVSDVQLVQFLIHSLIQENPELKLRNRYGMRINGLATDGICGNQTCDAIKGFQNFVRVYFADEGEKANISCDGLVDPANGRGIATVSGTIYTIVWLNALREMSTKAPIDSEQVSIEPLRSSLTQIRGGDAPRTPDILPPPPPPDIIY